MTVIVRLYAPHQKGKELKGRLVGPLNVVDYQDQRTPLLRLTHSECSA